VRKPWPTVGNDADAQLAGDGQDLVLDVAATQRPLRLQGADRMDCAGAAQRLGVGLREPEVAHLALGDELGHRAHGLLDRHLGVDAVQVEQVDVFGAQARQGRLTAGACSLRPSVDARPPGPRTIPNFVASTTSSRRPAIALAMSASLCPSP
jgi:hypothetical protein